MVGSRRKKDKEEGGGVPSSFRNHSAKEKCSETNPLFTFGKRGKKLYAP